MPKTKKEYRAFYEKSLNSRNEWAKEHTIPLHMRFNIEADADILEWLSNQSNKTDKVRELIRAEIEREAKR